MEEITIKDYNNLPVIIHDDTLISITSLKIGNRYLIRENEEYVDSGSVVTVYEVISKHNNRIESKPVVLKVV